MMNDSNEPTIKKKKNEITLNENSNFMVQYKELIKKRQEKDNYYKDNDVKLKDDLQNIDICNQKDIDINSRLLNYENDTVQIDEKSHCIKDDIFIEAKDNQITQKEISNESRVIFHKLDIEKVHINNTLNKDSILDYECKHPINYNQRHVYQNNKEDKLSNLNFTLDTQKKGFNYIIFISPVIIII